MGVLEKFDFVQFYSIFSKNFHHFSVFTFFPAMGHGIADMAHNIADGRFMHRCTNFAL